jgi:hypothetical protein
VSDEADKTSGEEKSDEAAEPDQERPTVAPPFDPIAFAKEILGGPEPGKKTPAGGTAAARPQMNTLSDPGELEEARQRSMGTPAPPRRATPTGALSLADSNAPSIPAPYRRIQSTNNLAAVDREWEELATSPPPPMQQELIDAMTGVPSATTPQAFEPEPAPEPPPPAPPPPPPPVDDDSPEIETLPSEQEMNDRVALGDYTGALDIAEKLLLLDPEDEEAQQCAESCRGVLRQMYTARIGALDRVPMVMVPRDQLRWLSIDHRAGFVLSLIDGVSSLEMILDVTGMPELDALRILSELVQQRIISFR